MINLVADASLKDLPALFPPPFYLSYYDNVETLKALLPSQDVLLCRSTLKVDASLLEHTHLQYIATASSGIDHIDLTLPVTVLDAKGTNATSVADYVMATLAYLELQGMIKGRRAGVIGVGAVGSMVMNRLQAMGYEVIGHDPYLGLHHFDALTKCDLLCIHPNLHMLSPYPSHHLIHEAFLAKLRPHTVLINASRGGVVDESALLASSIPITYCTDVYLNEPNISPHIIDYATLCTPHIAGHSIEAKRNALIVLSQQLHQHFNLPIPLTIQRELQNTNSASLTKATDFFASKIDWRAQVLSLYNPVVDTAVLKAHPDKKLAFLSQRNAHTHRHDFACDAHSGKMAAHFLGI